VSGQQQRWRGEHPEVVLARLVAYLVAAVPGLEVALGVGEGVATVSALLGEPSLQLRVLLA
jgi:hypothetical protein